MIHPALRIVDDALIRDVVARIVAECRPLKVMLFGSRARGSAQAYSDVDLLVIVPESHAPPAARAARLLATCRPPLVAMDVLVRTSDEIAKRRLGFDPFLEQILNEGKVLYDATG